ncbi:MAG: DUF1801 domain-containing protein [Phycisphaerales bacterium]|nr:DUF1801 domain-containing protein [Phycisphaerales bacterium]
MPRKALVSTVADFFAGLPANRRDAVERVRDVIRSHLPPGYEEAIGKGMLVYQVPLATYGDTHNGHPLWYVALASEKSYLSLHLLPIYGSRALADRLASGFQAAGKRLDRGKACIHFQSADDLPLECIGAIVASIPIERWIEIARAARRR